MTKRTKRTKTGKKQKADINKSNRELDTSMGKYYLENKMVKRLNVKGEAV